MANKNILDLDDRSLATIFNLLDIDEWIELSRMTKRFNQVIRKHVIPVQIIDVVGPYVNYSMNELFQMFGKCMTKLRFDAQNYVCKGRTRNCAGSVFEVFLQMLLDYCEPGMLKDVRIWNINEKIQNKLIDEDFLAQTAAYFKNMTKLKISFQCDDNSVTAVERWLASIPDEQIQSLTIAFEGAQQYDFKLKPNSFPNVQKMWLTFPPSNDISLNKVTDFIRLKSNLQNFYCDGLGRDLGDEIIKTAAKYLTNIKALSVIDLNSKPEDIRLEEFKDLRAVEFRGSMANYQEFHNIFKIIASQNTLKYMGIFLDCTEDSSIPGEFLSFLKSDCTREKIYLEELCIIFKYIEWDVEMYLHYLIVDVFNFKTLNFYKNTSYKLIDSAVANVGCLENVVCREMRPTEKYYKEKIMEKLMIQQKLKTSNRLNLYIPDAETHILQLGSHYDPQLIALKPRSKYAGKNYWT